VSTPSNAADACFIALPTIFSAIAMSAIQNFVKISARQVMQEGHKAAQPTLSD
jgi:hypothetical protein